MLADIPTLLIAAFEGLIFAAVLALMASGLSLVFGVMRVVNVAHGEFYMLGAVAAWFITSAVGGGPMVAFLAALIFAPLLVGAFAAALDMTLIARVNYDPERTIVATIGLLYILQQGTLMTFGPVPKPVEAPFDTRIDLSWFERVDGVWQSYQPWGFSISTYDIFVIVTAVVVISALRYAMTHSKAGLLMRATQLDSETAQAFGIPVARVYAGVFGVGCGLAALAGVLIVPIQQANFLMGGEALLSSFIVVIIGGLGSFRGTILAAILIGMSDALLTAFFSPTLAKILATLFVALVLVFRPQGLFGSKRH